MTGTESAEQALFASTTRAYLEKEASLRSASAAERGVTFSQVRRGGSV